MRPKFRYVPILATLLFAVVAGRVVLAEDIGGTITLTKIIMEDSRLVADVACRVPDNPCIAFGRSGIKLSLNGFTISGTANPDDASTCNATIGNLSPPTDLVTIAEVTGVGFTDVQLLGPGIVQRSRRNGVFIAGAPNSRVTVKQVTSHHNCGSGIMISNMFDSIIEGNVSIRNGMISGTAPRGGLLLQGSNNNHVRRNQFGGNGSVCPAPTCTPAEATAASNNDFGIGILGAVTGNLIEANSISGNSNGVLIQAAANGNVVRRNIIAGNAPAQVTRDYGPIGFDIKDESATNAGRNLVEDNQCVSYSGSVPSPCPNVPKDDPITLLTAEGGPTATDVSLSNSVNVGGSFTATFSGSNLGPNTYFDVRFRMPGSTTEVVALNWQKGVSAAHVAPVGTAAGMWIITGVRAHSSLSDSAGPFTRTSTTLSVLP